MDTIRFSAAKKPLMIAHRGCSGLEKENTNAAFVAAGNRSYFGIETDVHRTKDGRFIIIHDDSTQRVCGADLTVENTDYETLRALKLFDVSGEKGRTDLCLPSLSEYIGLCEKYEKIPVLELKNAFSEPDIVQMVDLIRQQPHPAEMIYISFFLENLKILRRLLPDQPLQFLTQQGTADTLIPLLSADRLDLDIYHRAITPDLVRACHENGIRVNTWTVNTMEEARRVSDAGVDFITTNILE